ncbi:ABC transporter ATP-binding protein/permease [Paenibacillus sp. ACRRX]|uniref:ABC transporter ATP-binding protein n=1 Tax=unclassified Paenibacillus TaxID=185978 RepID=UPI001EF5978B|nr:MULTISPECIES: ABC transporter ATP-binding protein [unclassified Paenibacillus]MCG7408542.1 ABC transporter ATP-binding protein/permease [Paenibacillus sp. ACRRX]MDK8182790.1 ABC transporter ATP-binding protein [Paenibacillus sp. UMB4589-SE434]
MNSLIRYLKPYWAAALLAPLFMILEVGMDLLQPQLMASIVNDGVLKGDLNHIWHVGAVMIGVAMVGLIGGAGCTVFSSKAAQNFGADLRYDLFRHIQTFSFRDLDRMTTGSLVTRLTSDIVQVQNMVQIALRIMVRSPFMLLGSIIMAVIISPQLSLVLAITIPLLLAVLLILMRLSIPMFAKVQHKLDRVNTVLQENLSGIRVVKAFVRSEYEEKRFETANQHYFEHALKAFRTIAINMPLMMLVLNTSIVAVLWYGGAQTWDGTINVGQLIAYLNYMTQILFSLLSIGSMIMNISRAKASADRIKEVLNTVPDMEEAANPRHEVVQNGRISFEHVSFAYDEGMQEQVLKDIHFQVEAGKTVAIIGATGSGKSSLVSLIPRLYEPTSGNVLIDGHNIKEMDVHELRRRVGMVLQQALLFSGTIRDNIRYGVPEASQAEVEDAARAAEAHEFIERLPGGYDTVVGQRGVNLSGGQKQRISLARTLLAKPDILILDDSMSAVDLKTEARIQQSLRERMRNSTSIVIAQRISSIVAADSIIVLEDGQIAAQGTHDELLRSSSLYQDIVESQLRKEDVLHG